MTEELLVYQIIAYTVNRPAETVAQGHFNGIMGSERFSDMSEFAALTKLKTLKAQLSNLQEASISVHSSLLGMLSSQT